MIGNPNVALVVFLLGVLGIYAGLCGRILIGVVGGVIAMVALASLVEGWAVLRVHAWVAIAVCVPFMGVTVLLLRVVKQARRNKAA